MRILTYQQLVEAKACYNQLALFRERYGDSVLVTVEAALEAAPLFNWNWAAMNLLTWEGREAFMAAFRPAQDTYKSAVRPAWKAYMAASRLLREAYMVARQSAPARVTYQTAKRSIWGTYDAAQRSAREVYDAALAEAFARAYISDGEGEQ